MAIKTFQAVAGQSIHDVCLNTYGTLDLMFKLLQDNSIDSIDSLVYSRQLFKYDDQLIVNQGVSQRFAAAVILYATDVSKLGSTYFVIGAPGFPAPALPPAGGGTGGAILAPIMATASTFFTSGADGTTVIVPTDKDGLSMVGYDIVYIEDEIKGLKFTQYVWNKPLGTLTLIGGLTLDNLQTLFIIYTKTV